MAMSRKDYVAVADVFRHLHNLDFTDRTPEEMRVSAVFALNDIFKENNPNFDSDKFLDACCIYK